MSKFELIENIRELNNPLPMWWLWLFILTIIYAAIYLAVYPGLGNFAGLTEWSQESQYEQEVAAAEERYGPMFANYGAMEVPDLVTDPKALSIGSSLVVIILYFLLVLFFWIHLAKVKVYPEESILTQADRGGVTRR